MEEGARRFTEATVVKGLRTVPTNSKVFLPRVMIIQEM